MNASGIVATYDLNINPEDFDIVPSEQDLYCVVPTTGILKLNRKFLSNYVGDLIVTQAGERTDGAALFIVHWDGTVLRVCKRIPLPSRNGNSLEHVTFSPDELNAL